MAKSSTHWVHLGELTIFANCAGGTAAPIDRDWAERYASAIVDRVADQLRQTASLWPVRIERWRWEPGCIKIVIAFAALTSASAAGVDPVIVATGAATTLIGTAYGAVKDYKNLRDGVVHGKADLAGLWGRVVDMCRQLAPRLPRPTGVQAKPILYSASEGTPKPSPLETPDIEAVRRELIEHIENGGATAESALTEEMYRSHRIKPNGSLLTFVLHDRADPTLLRQLHACAIRTRPAQDRRTRGTSRR